MTRTSRERPGRRTAGLLAALLLLCAAAAARGHEPGEDDDLPPGTVHELRITSITSLTVTQQITQPAVCGNPGICLHDEIHLPVVIDFDAGVIASAARAPVDEHGDPVPPGAFGGLLFQTQAGPAELRLVPPCLNPDGCVGGTPIYLGTIDVQGNIHFPSIGLNFELFGVFPVSKFNAQMGTGRSTSPTDPNVVAEGSPLDFTTGAVALAGIQFVPAPIIGNALELNTIRGTIVPVPVPPASARALLGCQAALAGGGAGFAAAAARGLEQCARALLACEIAAEAGATVSGRCVARAEQGCTRALGKIAAARDALAARIGRACTALNAANLLATAQGLGFGLNAAQCAALGAGMGGKEGIAACVGAAVGCAVEDLVGLLVPRAGEVLAAHGFDDELGDDACLAAGEPGDAAGHDGRALQRCGAAIGGRSAAYVRQKQDALAGCVDGYLGCQLRADRGDLDGTRLARCRAKAQRRCTAAVGRIDRAAAARDTAIRRACGSLDAANIPALADGLGFANLADRCAALDPPVALTDLDALLGCLGASQECAVETLVRGLRPRAAEVLAGVAVDGTAVLERYACLASRCGDGVVDADEECDPLFPLGGTCQSDCTAGLCGDGVQEGAEACDDGNTRNGDGCSSTCALEPCGNGVVEPEAGEVCDDGDTAGGDGCSPDCRSVETCGNGIVDTLVGETCDDGGRDFAATLEGAQETPPIATAASGAATLRLNEDDTLTYEVVAADLTGIAAHIHAAPPGEPGDIIIGLAGGPTLWSGTTAPLSVEQLALLRAGGLYVNVHTAVNLGGEIRGQIGFAASASGDGCSADCRSDETCGNGVIDGHVGEACDDGNTTDGDGCDATCAFESCPFFASADPLGTRSFSVDASVGGLFNSIVGLGTRVGTIGFVSGPFLLTATATDASGTAVVSLDGDVTVGIAVPGGGFTQCLRFHAAGSTGTLHCCGGHAVGMSFTRDSNTGGIPAGGANNGPAIVLGGIGAGHRGDVLMAFQVSESAAALASPGDCATASYGGPRTVFWTTGQATGRVVRPLQGGTIEFGSGGQAFDCASWTTTDGAGAFVSADTALNAVAGVLDAANLRLLDDQAGD